MQSVLQLKGKDKISGGTSQSLYSTRRCVRVPASQVGCVCVSVSVHHIQSVFPFPSGCNENDGDHLDRDQQSYPPSQKTKRMRTSFKHHQLRTMKSYFAINHNPDAKDLKQLAQKTGLTKRVLQVSPVSASSLKQPQHHLCPLPSPSPPPPPPPPTTLFDSKSHMV